jgi:hypothetical protein
MSEGFQHAIAGGQGKLIVSQLQSPNFQLSPLTGWAVLKNGEAYFADVIVSGSFEGNDFLVTTVGMFFYAGTPALGNLILSVVPGTAAVTDPEGNTAQPGVTAGLASSTQIQLFSSGGVGQLQYRFNSSSFTNALVEGAIIGTFADLVINGPATTTAGFKDFVGIELNSSDGVSSQANMEFVYTNTSGGASVIGSFNGSGWTLGTTAISNLSVSGSVTSDLHIDGTVYGTGGVLTIGDAVQLNNNLTVTGTLSVGGSTDTGGPTNNSTSTNGLTSGVINGTSGAQSTGTAHTHSAGSYAVANGQHSHTLNSHAHPL